MQKKSAYKNSFIKMACLFSLLSTPLLGLQSAIAAETKQTDGLKDFTLLAKKAIPAVVSITTKSTKKARDQRHGWFDDHVVEHFFGFFSTKETSQPPVSVRQGSGFLVTANGYIVTNAHLAADSEEIFVHLYDGRQFSATLVGQDSNTDIAMIKISGDNFPFLELGDSLTAEIGEWVAAIGNPLGPFPFLTAGVVSSKSSGDLDFNSADDLLQTDARISRGNSGGPLLNLSGLVIGMNTSLTTNTSDYVGIGFAIPSHMIRFVSQQLIEKGQVVRGYLGFVLQPITPELASMLGAQKTEGALVADVQSGSSAEKAGIKRGDLILKYNEKPVENAARLRTAIALSAPGSQATLQILRNKQPMQVQVGIAAFPKDIGPFAVVNESMSPNPLGIEVQKLTPVLAEKFGLIGYEGVVIRDVAPGTMAAWMGLSEGTLILEINQEPIVTVDDFYRITAPLKKGDNVLMLVREHSLTHYLTYRMQ